MEELEKKLGYTFRDPELLGKKVKVYVENDNFKHYYVDVDEILPKYVEH